MGSGLTILTILHQENTEFWKTFVITSSGINILQDIEIFLKVWPSCLFFTPKCFLWALRMGEECGCSVFKYTCTGVSGLKYNETYYMVRDSWYTEQSFKDRKYSSYFWWGSLQFLNYRDEDTMEVKAQRGTTRVKLKN